jgi:hypothetical protein
MRRPVHVLERGADVQEIVNMAAVAVIDAQQRSPAGAAAEGIAESIAAESVPVETPIGLAGALSRI